MLQAPNQDNIQQLDGRELCQNHVIAICQATSSISASYLSVAKFGGFRKSLLQLYDQILELSINSQSIFKVFQNRSHEICQAISILQDLYSQPESKIEQTLLCYEHCKKCFSSLLDASHKLVTSLDDVHTKTKGLTHEMFSHQDVEGISKKHLQTILRKLDNDQIFFTVQQEQFARLQKDLLEKLKEAEAELQDARVKHAISILILLVGAAVLIPFTSVLLLPGLVASVAVEVYDQCTPSQPDQSQGLHKVRYQLEKSRDEMNKHLSQIQVKEQESADLDHQIQAKFADMKELEAVIFDLKNKTPKLSKEVNATLATKQQELALIDEAHTKLTKQQTILKKEIFSLHTECNTLKDRILALSNQLHSPGSTTNKYVDVIRNLEDHINQYQAMIRANRFEIEHYSLKLKELTITRTAANDEIAEIDQICSHLRSGIFFLRNAQVSLLTNTTCWNLILERLEPIDPSIADRLQKPIKVGRNHKVIVRFIDETKSYWKNAEKVFTFFHKENAKVNQKLMAAYQEDLGLSILDSIKKAQRLYAIEEEHFKKRSKLALSQPAQYQVSELFKKHIEL